MQDGAAKIAASQNLIGSRLREDYVRNMTPDMWQ